MTKVENYTSWMEQIANDPSHGYSQASRWGTPDYDCSSLVISACERAGIPVKTNGATYTGNMKSVFLKCGFKNVTAKVNLVTGSGMQRGDILLNETHHTAVYCGNGLIVHARGQSFGSSSPGDQGKEISITGYYNYPWDCVLRYSSAAATSAPKNSIDICVGECKVTLGEFAVGCVSPQIKTIQILLNSKGFKGKNKKKLEVDGEFGENTAYAITRLQKKAGMTGINFGTVSEKTWNLLLK